MSNNGFKPYKGRKCSFPNGRPPGRSNGKIVRVEPNGIWGHVEYIPTTSSLGKEDEPVVVRRKLALLSAPA